ncbi:hypothetical protein AXG93_3893s1110 [Marchantia polymorpha subsp. ruderalis]|uniref:DUF7780 domain-containing protein n=1 Tax=Marchantia polymorpha subsp. ruderalis TaxID=1480154 RepID=A0A176WAL5_MARPO|nr:hypothetical protein AXG93_3893s1110 [Marchantia polymorpha subsp. ruderalis]
MLLHGNCVKSPSPRGAPESSSLGNESASARLVREQNADELLIVCGSKPSSRAAAPEILSGRPFISQQGMDQPWLRSDPSVRRSGPGRILQSTSLKFDDWRRSSALHGLGVTFRKGSRAMSELVVAHVEEATTADDLRLFLRTLHRSGVTARADVVLLFPSSPVPKVLADVVNEEERSWWEIMLQLQSTAAPHSSKESSGEATEDSSANREGRNLQEAPSTPVHVEFPDSNSSLSSFHATAFWKAREEGKPRGDAFWGGSTARSDGMTTAVDWGDWGSVVGFEMQDLDSDEALKGFIEEPPARLRRWISYQMLLGMVKSKFRSVLLAAVGEVLVMGDVLAVTRKKTYDLGLLMFQEDRTWKELHSSHIEMAKNSALEEASVSQPDDRSQGVVGLRLDETSSEAQGLGVAGEELASSEGQRSGVGRPELQFIEEVYGKEKWKVLEEEDKEKSVLGSGLIMGHMKPVRSLLGTMGTEIVGVAALVRKSRQSFSDRPLLNFLVHKSTVLSKRVTDKLHIMTNRNSNVHSLPGSKQRSVFYKQSGGRFAALQGLKDELVDANMHSTVLKSVIDDICSSLADSKFYSDCSSPNSLLLSETRS